jgi:hypothetical protein
VEVTDCSLLQGTAVPGRDTLIVLKGEGLQTWFVRGGVVCFNDVICLFF